MIKEFTFKGVSYLICCEETYADHPTWFSHVDESEVRNRDWNILSGDFVIDIGSNYGSYALTALAAGAAHIYCVNYNVEENTILHSTVELNGWGDRVDILETGVYSKQGYLSPSGQFSEVLQDGYFQVKALDNLLESIPVSGYQKWHIKIDVEGSELYVLKGMERFLSRTDYPELGIRFNIEVHDFINPNLAEYIHNYLSKFGYREVSDHPYHSVRHVVYEI